MLKFESLSNKLITSYQRKATFYDKQQWEKSIEDHIIQRAENIYSHHDNANKSYRHHASEASKALSFPSPDSATNDLIDLDLISGSAYQIKPKSQQGWLSSCLSSLTHVTLFPLYFRWWYERTTRQMTAFLLFLYVLQLIALYLYFYRSFSTLRVSSIASSWEPCNTTSGSKPGAFELAQLPPIEVLMPIFMMFVLGFLHTQIFETKDIKPNSSSKTNSLKSSWNKPSRKNSQDDSLYRSQHTECSSSPLSSSSCSAESSPVSSVSNVKRHYQKKLSKASSTVKIKGPKITIDNEDTNLEQEKTGFSDAQIYKLQHKVTPKRKVRRRYSDFSYLAESRQRASQAKDKSLNTLRRRYVRKLNNRNKNHDSQYYEFETIRWSNENNSLTPESLNYFGGFYGNPNDSEGTVSPTTPIMSIPSDEWPMVNSDENTSGDDYYEKNQSDGKSSPLNVEETSTIEPKQDEPSLDLKGKVSNDFNLDGKPRDSNAKREFIIAQPSNELKVSCSTWQHNQFQKRDLSVTDISSAIIRKVDAIEHSSEYIYLGLIFSFTIAMLPTIYRLQYLLTSNGSNGMLSTNSPDSSSPAKSSYVNPLGNTTVNSSQLFTSDLIQIDIFGFFRLFLDENLFSYKSYQVRLVIIIAFIERFFLSMFYFFLLCVAERTFKQRFLYSKYFSQITRRDRALRSQIPHFRLHKVRNLKVWLSVRSYLRRHGPHRSVDIICSTSFVIAVCLLTCISLQMLKDSSETYTSRLICWEMIFWCLTLGVYIMRLMILGSRINQKYRGNLSILITEQINLYLQLERKPHKKDALMLANHVLKLAVDLLKELESPYKISGFSANPYLYNITKVVVLSAFSAVLTEMLGFKLKLYKIKLIR